MYCHVTTETAFCVFHFLQRFFPEWPIRTCSKITAVLLLCTDDDNRSYRNVCSMPFLSFALAVIFIIRLFSTSAFRVTSASSSPFSKVCDGSGAEAGSWSIASWITSILLVSLFFMKLSKLPLIFSASSLFFLCLTYWTLLSRGRWRFRTELFHLVFG